MDLHNDRTKMVKLGEIYPAGIFQGFGRIELDRALYFSAAPPAQSEPAREQSKEKERSWFEFSASDESKQNPSTHRRFELNALLCCLQLCAGLRLLLGIGCMWTMSPKAWKAEPIGCTALT
jgi:hypothetical protein